MITGEEAEGKEQIISFIDAPTDPLEIHGIAIQVQGITIMIHIEKILIVRILWMVCQMDLLCTLIPTTLADLLGGVAARLKL